MNRWRTIVILFLLLAPVMVFVGFGGYQLWETGQLVWMWITLPASWAIVWLLMKLWGNSLSLMKPPVHQEPGHWTPRDRDAWKIVEARMQQAEQYDPTEFTKLQFYVDAATEMSREIAVVYHPDATDPLSSLTIPEIMAAAQLALEDLAEIFDQYVPAGHMMTIKNWRSLSKLPRRYRQLSNIANAAALLFSPLAAAGRYVASKTIMAPVTRAIQSNLLAWFYASFLQRTGVYLIEMNSGRLRGGKERFREAMQRMSRPGKKPWDEPAQEAASSDDPAKPQAEETEDESLADSSALESTMTESESAAVTICVAGQSGSGRSSVVRALIKDLPDKPERLKKAETVTVHRLQLPDSNEEIRMLETIGYSNFEESSSIRKDRLRAIAQSDLLLVIMNAADPARDADLRFLDDTAGWFDEKPHLKPPAAIAVLTHIDLLKPPMKWDPPYNWRKPKEMKEQSIHDAVEHVRAELGQRVVDVVPVCADGENERAFGVEEWLEPAIAMALDSARAVSTVRHLHDDLGHGGVSRVLQQVWNIGKALRGK